MGVPVAATTGEGLADTSAGDGAGDSAGDGGGGVPFDCAAAEKVVKNKMARSQAAVLIIITR